MHAAAYDMGEEVLCGEKLLGEEDEEKVVRGDGEKDTERVDDQVAMGNEMWMIEQNYLAVVHAQVS